MEKEKIWYVGFEALPITAKSKEDAIRKMQDEIGGLSNPVPIDENNVYPEEE
ncbi:unnamed protein product [marine sediment metagenome]|uniref:Uncharacterized protein n=1 Tax=marine sediment metagenome TaxID=412755 RepID=X1IRY8_9ZZZZ